MTPPPGPAPLPAEPPVLTDALDPTTAGAIRRATAFATLGTTRPADYHSVAGQPAQALAPRTGPLSLMDFIDARLREIAAEHDRLHMLKQQLVTAGVSLSVDDIRRVLG